jgi:hypothetical protein
MGQTRCSSASPPRPSGPGHGARSSTADVRGAVRHARARRSATNARGARARFPPAGILAGAGRGAARGEAADRRPPRSGRGEPRKPRRAGVGRWTGAAWPTSSCRRAGVGRTGAAWPTSSLAHCRRRASGP